MTPKVRAVILTDYVEIASSLGLDPYAMLLEKQILPRHLRDPEWRLSAGPVISLIEDTAARADCPEFGILMANCRSFPSLGPLSLLLQHLPTPRDVIACADEFRYLLNDITSSRIDEVDKTSLIRCTIIHEGAGFQSISLFVAVAFRVLVESSGKRWYPYCVHFTHTRPKNIRPFQEYFRADIAFESDFDGFSCPTRSLEIHNPSADSLMARHARKLLKLLPVNRPGGAPLEGARQAIALMLGFGQPTLATVAADLGVSVRSLQRMVAAEGRSFSQLLNEARRQLALRYVGSSSLPLARVAEMVGYNSGSAFSRWFAQEFGETPRAWRSKRSHVKHD